MYRWLTILIVFVFMDMPVLSFAAPMQRTALVIGNSSYQKAPLRNPANDAADMAAALLKLGFDVTFKTDADQRTMELAIRAFGKKLRDGGVGLFYYAGHGLQLNGRNYLVPIGAQIETQSEVKYEAVDAGRVLGQMEDAGNNMNIIILDACRNNPFARAFRSADQGLAKMDAPTGSILAYATAPGSVAADGAGRNGLYTEKLLAHMQRQGITIERVFKLVRRDVTKGSQRKQVPWESSSLIGDFYFNPTQIGVKKTARAIAVVKRPDINASNAELEAWEIVKSSTNMEDFNLFLDQYPVGRFNGAAKLKIQQLQRKQTSQRLSATLHPAAVTSSNGKRREPINQYRMAIFSVKLFATGMLESQIVSNELASIQAIASVAAFDERLSFKYCYRELEGITGGVTILKDGFEKDAGRLWKKRSLFSALEPDWKAVQKAALALDTDLIVMINGNLETSSSHFYLYDLQNDKVYSQKANSYWQTFGHDVQIAVRGLVKDYFSQ